ncbi:hypothetical protein [Sphingomonas oleivorans]|nr:hypothetical protein [Sphingomonas oleivorans]
MADLSDRQLAASLARAQAGKLPDWPAEMKERIFGLIEILNRAN